MRYLLCVFLMSQMLVAQEDQSIASADNEVLDQQSEENCCYCHPYDADCDECWYFEDEATYPTQRQDSWVEELSYPW